MSEHTDRLRKEIAALRAELRKDRAFDSIRWDELLAAAPAPLPVPVAPAPVPVPPAHDHGEAHHTRALPALVTDDDGTTRVIVPPGHRSAGPSDNGPPHEHDHGHEHGNHDHDHGDHDREHDNHGNHRHDHGDGEEGHGRKSRRPRKR